MILSRKNKTLFIDKEASSALELLKSGLLSPLKKLMNKQEVETIYKTGQIDGQTFPLPFILAPSGVKNEEIIKSLKQGEEVDIICEDELFATLIVDEVFQTDPKKRIKHIFGTDDMSHPEVKKNIQRLGSWAVSGDFKLSEPFSATQKNKQLIEKAKSRVEAKHTTALITSANPLHRAHERLIRQILDYADLLVIFLQKDYDNELLDYDIRKETLEFLIKHFIPKNKVLIIPLDNSYVFAGHNELIIDAIVAKNYGCDRLTINRDHKGLGMFYDSNSDKSILDKLVGIDIKIKLESEFVYCNQCTTLINKNTCPHGQHHQISYHAESILELLKMGLLPPPILMRKEISSFLLSKIFPNRFKNLEKLYYDLLPVEGLLKEHSEKDFYLELIKLYQTTSLT